VLVWLPGYDIGLLNPEPWVNPAGWGADGAG